MSKPIISIVVPIYNVELYLGECLDSLVSQNFQDLEILLINDGSTDCSQQICEQYESKYPAVRLLNKINGGCATARNFGLMEARGEYVGFVDSDDWVTPNMYQLLYEQIKKTRADIIQCGFEYYYQKGHIFERMDDSWVIASLGENGNSLKVNPQILYLQPAIWRRIYRKSFLEEHELQFPILPRFDDMPFQFMTFAHAEKIVAIKEHCYFYRLNRAGQDIEANDHRLFVHFEIFNLLDEFVTQENFKWLVPYYIKVKTNTHEWALSKLVKKYKGEYRNKVIDDMKRMLNNWLLLDADRNAVNQFLKTLS